MRYFQNGLDQICQQIVRPARADYSLYDLASFQNSDEITYTREDLDLQNPRQEIMKVSQYKGQQRSDVCIIYLHTANGSRMEIIKYVALIIKNGFHLISFDFTGSGMSEGELVTYGHREVGDLNTVITHFQMQYKQIILWGRSMGSVVAIQYMQRINNQIIKGLILDSPFVSLLDVILQMASNKTKIPNFILKSLSSFVSNELKKKAGFELEDINCFKKINQIKCPAIFVTSKTDLIVPAEQTEKLYKAYIGLKQIYYTNQSHNGIREPSLIETMIQWFKRRTPIFERLGVGTQIKQKIMHRPKNTMIQIKQISLDLHKERSATLDCKYQDSINVNMAISPRHQFGQKQNLSAEEKYNQLLETQRSLYLDRSISAQRIPINNSIEFSVSPLAPISNKIQNIQQHNYFSHSKPIEFTKVPHKTKDRTYH